MKNYKALFERAVWVIKKSLGLERLKPYLLQEQREALLYRSRILCWVGLVIYPATILPFNYFFYPDKLVGGLIASIPSSLAAFLLFLSLRSDCFKGFYNQNYHLPIFLLLGVISNYAQTVNLQVTGGGGGGFFFPYLLIYIAFAVFYPGNFAWVLATAFSLIAAYIFSEWWMGRELSSVAVTANMIYLVDSAFLCTTANRVFYRYFLRDKERQLALEEANIRLKALDEAKTRFFTNLTHEFRIPLVANSTLLQAIREEVPLTPGLQVLLDSATVSLGQMLENVNDLLTQTRSEKGFLEIRWSLIEIVELVEKSIGVLRTLAGKQGTEIILINGIKPAREGMVENFTIYGDRSKLKKVINNLLSNAIKFTRGGQICIRLNNDDKFLKIEVQDSVI